MDVVLAIAVEVKMKLYSGLRWVLVNDHVRKRCFHHISEISTLALILYI